jgi:MSHA biogenesis protein MshP
MMNNMPKVKGFSLISAIFLLVVIAALGTFAVTLSTTQHTSSAQDVLGARAYQAARSGIEWGAYQLLITGGGCGAATQNLPAGTMAGTLSGFSVNVVCASSAHTEAGTPVTMYQLTSTAQQGVAGTSSYVEREIKVVIAK